MMSYLAFFTAQLTPDQMIIAQKVCNVWEKYRYVSLKVRYIYTFCTMLLALIFVQLLYNTCHICPPPHLPTPLLHIILLPPARMHF